jgi:pyridinium-3,5-bisthiocarboxylic acid mononucleotide nickel chelatase
VLAYVDCFSGISGDMLLGALIDAGVEPAALRAVIATLPLGDVRLDVRELRQHGIAGKAVRVIQPPEQSVPERRLVDVLAIVERGDLSARSRDRVSAIFHALAVAESHVHGSGVEEVHFHEVGAVDAIVDVVGAVVGLELLGIENLWWSELPLTSGRVRSQHGDLPVPAPATVELLRGTEAVWRPVSAEGELVTPTGAAILATLGRYGRPAMRIERSGYGFGERALPWANCLRLLIGPVPESSTGVVAAEETDSVVVIQANIDDMTGEALGWLMDHLLAAGALDVSFAPLAMKKNRPGTLVTVMAAPGSADALARELLRSSTTLGVRTAQWQRRKAARRIERVSTPLGVARVKLKLLGDEIVSVAAEYEDARELATRAGLPVHEVIARVEDAARAHFGLGAAVQSGDAPADAL